MNASGDITMGSQTERIILSDGCWRQTVSFLRCLWIFVDTNILTQAQSRSMLSGQISACLLFREGTGGLRSIQRCPWKRNNEKIGGRCDRLLLSYWHQKSDRTNHNSDYGRRGMKHESNDDKPGRQNSHPSCVRRHLHLSNNNYSMIGTKQYLSNSGVNI